MLRAILKLVKYVFKKRGVSPISPLVIRRDQHTISRADISDKALKVLYRLQRHGFEAYLVGGSVRDLLLQLRPKDFDVVTNARPEEIQRVFRNCRLIGRRFRLAHIYFGSEIIEVATFRGKAQGATTHAKHGMILRDNVYGALSDDVWRRDFTINALYYNIADFSLMDYVGGFDDLKAKRLRMIGDVATRYREDPVRMLRAIRFASKIGFTLSEEITAPMADLKSLLAHVSPARLFEEVLKLLHSGSAVMVYEALLQHQLFAHLFPLTFECLQHKRYPTDALLRAVFQSTDDRIKQGKNVTPAFAIAALLWHPILVQAEQYVQSGMTFFPARLRAIEALLAKQAEQLTMPKKIVQGVRDIWMLQMRLQKRLGKHAETLMEAPRFRAAFDFLLLRSEAGEPIQALAQWWHAYVEGGMKERKHLLQSLRKGSQKKQGKEPA